MFNKPFYKSKKFWAFIITIAAPFVNKLTGFNLPTEEIVSGMLGGAAYIGGQSLVDSKGYKYLKHGKDVADLAGTIFGAFKKNKK